MISKNLNNFLVLSLVLSFCAPLVTIAQGVRSSSSYGITSDSLNFAGGLSSSASYKTESTAGENGTGKIDSTNYGFHDAGYLQNFSFSADTIPPSQPTSLVANPLTTGSVELTWSGSTDNIAVTGYYIYRNGIRIQSVASFPFNYVDSGLIPNTLYSYNVSAFDFVGNESLWSATSSATTFPVSTTNSGGGQSAGQLPTIKTNGQNPIIYIVPTETGALVSFDTTTTLSGTQIFWGLDSNYSSGTLTESKLTDSHHFVIQGLKPQTKYFLKIILTAQSGRLNTYENIQFFTLSLPFVRLPSNVSKFNATPNITKIDLDWRMPKDPTLLGVRLVRSTKFYPTSPNDGQKIFEDYTAEVIENFVDTDVTPGVTYFYTLFTKDVSGNYSSGAISSGRILKPGEPIATTTPIENIPESSDVDRQIDSLMFKDFLFIQDGNSLNVSNDLVTINGEKNLTLALKAFHLPEVLKTIAVTLITTDEEQKSFTFILRPNKDRTRFESTIGSLGTTSIYRVKISVIDFKNQGLKKLKGTLYVKEMASSTPTSGDIKKYFIWLIILMILALLLLAIRKFKKHHV